MIREIALLTNPAAGHGKANKAADRARARFVARGISVRDLKGNSAEHSRELAQEAVGRPTDHDTGNRAALSPGAATL